MAAADFDGDGAVEIAADFGSLGLWMWNGGVWSQVTGAEPRGPDRRQSRRDFSRRDDRGFREGRGLVMEGGAWSQLTGGNAQDMMFADTDNDGVGEFVGDFGPLGLWLWNGGRLDRAQRP